MREDSPVCSTINNAQAKGLTADAIDRLVWERHGTTRTMLALDSSGMTRVTRAQGIVHFLARYVQMRDLAQAVLDRHGCLAWRSFADNVFAEFRTADAALDAALEIHRALRERGIMLTDAEPYRVCIAIGHGRVLDNGPLGVLGDEMNLVAKLAEDIAAAGETLLTRAGFDSLTTHPGLPAEKIELTVSTVAVTCYRVRV
jgi:class 3 adenylate cyclase